VPLGSSRLAIFGSRRKDRIAAMEVMGLDMTRPPLVRRGNALGRDRIPPRRADGAAAR
jgi:hypothetical protein